MDNIFKAPYGTVLTCSNCGSNFVRDREHKMFLYCSEKCKKEAATKKIYVCKECGKEYSYDPDVSSLNYCSAKCREKHNKGINTESEEEVTALVRYLITKMNQAGSLGTYTPVYFTEVLNPTDVERKTVLERDKRSCRICNSRSNLEIHHIIKRRDGGKNNLDNLITLCKKCHRHIETGDVDHAIEKCVQNYIRIKRGESSIFAEHLNNLEKVEYAKEELSKLYAIVANSGEEVKTDSIKICIDDVLEKLE